VNSDFESSNLFDEDQLPSGQTPILTAGVKQCQFEIELLVRSRQLTGYSTMAVVSGWPGIGKTIAIQACINKLSILSTTELPACVQIKVKPGSTPRQLVEDLFICFGEKPHKISTNRYKIADDAAKAILSNDLKALFVDDADQLTTECFEFLRYIFAKTGCPIVVVGLREISRVINKHEKFQSRVGLRLDFPVPKEEEVLSLILPQLVVPYWTFDPALERDYLLGKALWASVKPSFRSLRVVIQYAGTLADMTGKKRITPDLLKQSYQMAPISKKQGELILDVEDEDEDASQTEYERESERRHGDTTQQDEESL
jgi:Cdc6-like AAA superfamily ATPase